MIKNKSRDKARILITGGHLTPALAVIDELQRGEYKDKVEIIFVGRKYTVEKEKVHSFEYQEIKKHGIVFRNLKAGRFTRILSWRSFINILKIPQGFLHAFQILIKDNPSVILTFGSYIGVPISIVGTLMGKPVYVHEQTFYPGLANKIIARVARKVFISFPESLKYFNKKKTIVTGNPVRPEIFLTLNKPFAIPSDRKVIYITGGALGSHSINVHIERILTNLLEEYIVIHQTGNVKEYTDYTRLNEARSKLSPELANRYFLRTHFLADEIGYIYSKADMVIGRSGANTFFELVALQKPSILIPLPWSGHGEQQAHARLLKEAGVSETFEQHEESSRLLLLIDQVMNNIDQYKQHFIRLSQLTNQHAARTIVQTIFN